MKRAGLCMYATRFTVMRKSIKRKSGGLCYGSSGGRRYEISTVSDAIRQANKTLQASYE